MTFWKKHASWLILPVLLLYYLYFAIPGLSTKFAPDDPMNLRYYWARGLGQTLLDDVYLWSGGYRPLGALFYLPIYHAFGLDPVPYRAVALLLLALALLLTFLLVDRLTGSKPAASLATIVMCAHPLMPMIFYKTAMIYDLLAYLLIAAMLYINLRRSSSIAAAAAIVVLYLAAIDAKEMAIVAALWIVAWELLSKRPWKLLVPALMIAISAIYALARTIGPHALAAEPGYKLDLTVSRFFTNNLLYWNDIFHVEFFDARWKWIAGVCLLVAICALVRRRDLWWACIAILTSTLPTSFTVWPRNDSSLCVPLLAWTIFGAILLTTLLKRPSHQWAFAAIAAVLFTYFAVPIWKYRRDAVDEDHRLTWTVMSQFRALPSRPSPHQRVIIVDDPFQDWQTRLIADIVWNDPTLTVDMGKKLNHPPDLASYDWVLTFQGERLVILRTR